MGQFADDAGEAGLAEPFFHGQQHRLPGAGFEMDHPVRNEPGAGEARREDGREKAARTVTPEHGPRKAREQAGCEQSGRTICRAARDLMHRTERQAAAGQVRIDCGEAECEHLAAALCWPFEPLDAGAEVVESEAQVLILFLPSGAVKRGGRKIRAAGAGPFRPPRPW